jgi:drug/metabolite transporter (DMT)-like permease
MHEAGLSGSLATTAGFLLPLILLLPFALATWRRILAGDGALGMAALCLASSIALYAEGLVRGQVARVILLFYLTPVWSTLLAGFFLSEPITWRRVTTIILGLAGMVVIFGGGARFPFPAAAAEWMGLTGGVLWAFAMVYVNRSASRPLFDRIFVQFVFLGPVFFLVTLIPGGRQSVSLEPGTLLDCAYWLLAFALIWMLPLIWLTIFGASRLDPGRVAICLMLEIVVGLTTASLLTDEPFGLREFVGAILIMGAGAVEITAACPRSPDKGPARSASRRS